MKPDDVLQAWRKEWALERIHGCRVMLEFHDFLTDAESKRVAVRIDKWAKKHGVGERRMKSEAEKR